MFEATLFLGLPLKGELLIKIKALDSSIKSLFIDSDPHSLYLQHLCLPEGQFLGKYVGPICELTHLHQLQTNIYSLLGKILPMPNCKEIPLVLISVKTPLQTN